MKCVSRVLVTSGLQPQCRCAKVGSLVTLNTALVWWGWAASSARPVGNMEISAQQCIDVDIPCRTKFPLLGFLSWEDRSIFYQQFKECLRKQSEKQYLRRWRVLCVEELVILFQWSGNSFSFSMLSTLATKQKGWKHRLELLALI